MPGTENLAPISKSRLWTALLLWVGLYFHDPELRALVLLRKAS
jgi:hypothetical protein